MTHKSDLTDEQLAKEVAVSEDAFYELMKRYEAKLLRYIRRTVKVNQETAEDILQETFIKTYRFINNFDTSLKFSSWIYRIAHNESISYWRKNQKNIEFISIDKEENGLANTLTLDNSTDDNVIEKEKQEMIADAINELPEKYRDVLVLRFLEQKEYDEISDVLQKPIGTVSALIHRAKQKLKTLDKKYNLQELI